MASPFAVFRKNQKVLLVGVTLAAILAFVILTPLMQYAGRSGGPVNPVVVETKYGALTESEMSAMRDSREVVGMFLNYLALEIVNQQVQQGRIDPRMQERAVDQTYNVFRQSLMMRSVQGPEEAVVETLVLSKKAEQLGMIVSDQAINSLLQNLTDNQVTSETIQAIVNRLSSGRRRISMTVLFNSIRNEILASRLAQLFRVSTLDVPPAQRFEYYERLNRRAKAEVMPLAVADFTKQVADPSAEVLTKFFDEHKTAFADPNSPTPGFKEPKRAAFQYFKADFARFKEEFKPKVTDEEIKEYYEKNKAQFRAAELPADPGKSEEPADDRPTETPKAEGEKPAEGDAKPADDKPGEGKSAEEKPASEKPAEEKPQASTGGPMARSPFVLVSTAAEDEKPAETTAPASEPKPEEAKPDEKQAEDNKPAEPAADAPATDEKKPEEEKPAADDKQPEADKPEIRYEPLEKVQDQIRDSIAGQKATQKIGEIFEDLSAQMRRYADELDAYEAAKNSNTKTTAQPPKPFPFKQLAEEKQVIAKETDLITAAEATSGTDIGQATRTIQDRRAQFGFRVETFPEFAYSDSLLTYRPTTIDDNEANLYLFWKTKEQAAYVPKLDQVREKVIHAWKMIQAREFARKRAEEYAQQDRNAKQPLKEFFAKQENLKVTETGEFSWLTSGNVPFDLMNSRPRLSPVEGVDRAGQEFMETVFNMAPGDVSVAANEPQTDVYVVRLTEFDPAEDELRTDFAAEKQMRYLVVAQTEQRDMEVAWLTELNKDAGVHWVRTADVAVYRGGSVPNPLDYLDE